MRLWIVEAQFPDDSWEICDFGLREFAATNYYDAHKIKKRQQEYLKNNGSKKWTKKRFRVKEYKAV